MDEEEQAFEDAEEQAEPEEGQVALVSRDGVVGMVRSLSQRTLALVAPPVQELLITLVGVWAQMLLVLLASSHKVSADDGGSSEPAAEEFLDAQEEVVRSVDSQMSRSQPQACC